MTMAKKLFNGRMLYVCVKGSRTIIGVFGSALEQRAREFIAQDPSGRMLWERKGLVQHVGEELKRGAKPVLSRFELFWSPTGERIASGVEASDARTAVRKAPKPHRKYLGEIYAKEMSPLPAPREFNEQEREYNAQLRDAIRTKPFKITR
jgi:hypothetical protein